MKKYRQAVSAMVIRPSTASAPDGCKTLQSILLVHKPRSRDAWQLPQGGVEEGETLEQAALRELQEEAGVTLSHVDYVSPTTYTYDFPEGFIKRWSPVNSGQTLHFVVIAASNLPPVVVDNDEIDAYVWVLPDELHRYLERQKYLDVVLQVLEEYRQQSR